MRTASRAGISACLPTCAPIAMNTASKPPASRSAITSVDLVVQHDPHAHSLDAGDLRHQIVARQAVGRDAEMQHAAGQRAGLVDLDLMTEPGQVIGGRQTARSGADHQDALARGGRDRHGPALGCRQVAEKTLDRVDRHGGVQLAAIAGGFARVIADPAVRRRQRVVGHQRFPGPPVVARLRQGQPGLDVLAGRAGVVAGRQQRDIVRQAGTEWSRAVAQRQIDDRGQIVGLPRRRHFLCIVHFGLRFPAQARSGRISMRRIGHGDNRRASAHVAISKALTWINQVFAGNRYPGASCHPV